MNNAGKLSPNATPRSILRAPASKPGNITLSALGARSVALSPGALTANTAGRLSPNATPRSVLRQRCRCIICRTS